MYLSHCYDFSKDCVTFQKPKVQIGFGELSLKIAGAWNVWSNTIVANTIINILVMWIWNELWWYPVVSVCSMNQHSWQCLHNDHMTRCPSAMSYLCCPVMSHVRFYHHMPRVGFWMLWWHFNASLSLTMRQGLECLEGRCGRMRSSLSIHKHGYYLDYFISEPSLS